MGGYTVLARCEDGLWVGEVAGLPHLAAEASSGVELRACLADRVLDETGLPPEDWDAVFTELTLTVVPGPTR
jgi:hypothetical protein